MVFKHKWFEDIDWEDVAELKINPPIKPEIRDKFDIENFNKDVIKEIPKIEDLKEIDQGIVDTYKEKFSEF